MMGPSPQCYIPCFVEIGPLVPEKIFEGFLPYIGVSAVLVMCDPDAVNKTFVPLTHRGSTQNLVLIGLVVSEEKIFEIVSGRTTTTTTTTDIL